MNPILPITFRPKLILAATLSLGAFAASAWAGEPPPSIHRAVREDDTTKIRSWLHKDMKLLNARDADGMTPLHVSVCKNRRRAFDLLIASGADVQLASRPAFMKIDREDGTVAFQARREGWTALHLAAFANRLEMAKGLMHKMAPVDAKNDFGQTPLYLAAQEGHLGMIRLLVAHGADIEAMPTNGKFTPLMSATFNHHLEAGYMLIANGARTDPLSAAGLGLVDAMESAVARNPGLIQDSGSALDSPLYWAARNGQFRAVSLLTGRKAGLEARDADMRTPLMVAAMRGHGSVVRTLIEHGAKINEWDRHGWTALHLAAMHNQTKMAATLLDMGARGDIRDLRNRTAADLAREMDNLDVVETIMEKMEMAAVRRDSNARLASEK